MNGRIAILSAVVASSAFAQATKVATPVAAPVAGALERAPIIKANFKLACAAGTVQVGGPTSNLAALTCMKMGTEGMRVFHGPMYSFYKGGAVEAVGQAEQGMRSGKWTLFDEKGNKTGETEFKAGDFHGRRVVYLANGQVKSEENWVEGKRQGTQKYADDKGVLVAADYKDDRPISTK